MALLTPSCQERSAPWPAGRAPHIACIDPLHRPVEEARRWAKAQLGWDWQELATARDCMVTAPVDVAAPLAAIS